MELWKNKITNFEIWARTGDPFTDGKAF